MTLDGLTTFVINVFYLIAFGSAVIAALFSISLLFDIADWFDYWRSLE